VLTAGAGSDREKAKRLYDWVRKNIRYVAIYAGLESWVPHLASQVLADRFGDCKDHAVLLDALLNAVGIESVPVLIQNDLTHYTLPGVASNHFFNHMISYLPGLDLYLDSTSPFAEFGRLPDPNQGKQVLRAGLPVALGQTPASKASDRQSKRSTTIEVQADGSATVTTTLWFGGDFRAWYDEFSQQNSRSDSWANQQLHNEQKRGSAFVKWLPDNEGWRGLEITQQIENYLPEGEIGLLTFGHAYVGPASIYHGLDLFETKSRTGSFSCQAMELSDTVEISLPEGLKLLRLPRNETIKGETAQLQVDYSGSDGRYTMQRSFRWDPGNSGSCSKAQWDEWKASMRKMRKAAKSGVLPYAYN
jgi:hypothetical protein